MCKLLLLLVEQLAELLFLLQVVLEALYPGTDFTNLLLLDPEHLFKPRDILIDIAARLVNVIQQTHLLLGQLHHLIYVSPMGLNQLLLLLQDLVYQVTMALVDLLQV